MKRNIIFTSIAISLALMLPGVLGEMLKEPGNVANDHDNVIEQQIHLDRILDNSSDTVVVAQPIN